MSFLKGGNLRLTKIKAYLKDFWRYRYLLINLISRDFKLKYRRSVLGVLWSVLNPLMMMLVMWAVFSQILDFRGTGITNFPVYLMIGQLLFTFFNESTSAAMASMIMASSLIKKVYIPKYIFPLEKICFSLVNTLFSFIALIFVMFLTGATPHVTMLMFFYPLGTLFVFSLGVGMFLSAMAVFFRDIMHMWTVFTTALLYFSAIFYDPSAIGSWLQQLIKFNPLYWYITAFREVVLNGNMLTTNMVLVCGGCALVSLVFGFIVFKTKQDKFILYI